MKLKGSNITEFALVFPIFIGLFLTDLYMFMNVLNLSAVENGLNIAVDGLKIDSSNYQTKIRNAINAQAIMQIPAANLIVEAFSYPSKAAALQETGGVAGTGSSGSFVIYKVTYNSSWPSWLIS